MPQKTKWFRVATEGGATDGRTITRMDIEQIAKSFDPKVYGARVWLEHFRGTVPGGPFDALGDVVAVKAEPVEDGKLALFAQIEPLPALVEMVNTKRQKIYSSIEIHPNFPATGGAYLYGLGVTDSPASLGTEVLKFSQTASKNPFEARKTDKAALFAEAVEFELDLEAEPEAGVLAKALEKFTTVMEKFTPKPDTKPETPPPATVQPHSADMAAMVDAVKTFTEATSVTVQQLSKQLADQQKAHAELVTKLSQQPADPGRPAATGGDGYEQADF